MKKLLSAVSVVASTFLSPSLVQASINADQPLLFCEPNKIYVNITKAYLRAHRIDIASSKQLHFSDHAACFAQETDNAYILNLYTPFTACGTILNHDTEDYIYTNQVVLDRNDGGLPMKLLEMRCVYEDKYVVTSGPLRPTKNTLVFDTIYGEFEADMSLYKDDRFDFNSKLDDRPSITLGDRVFVAVSLYIPFNSDYANDLTVTVKNCYANDDPQYKMMERYHYLISGMCASPDDNTVRIYQNGAEFQTESRFSFDMFRFRKGLDYIYIHCEVKLCNATAEICSGSGPFCDGLKTDNRRKRRAVETDLTQQTTDEDMITVTLPDPDDGTLAFLSRGPIIAQISEKVPTGAHVESMLEDGMKDDHFLRLWVFSGVAAVIGVVGIILAIFTIVKRRTAAAKLQQNGTVIRVETPAPKPQGNQGGWRTGPLPAVPSRT
jgi:hypothetical protein